MVAEAWAQLGIEPTNDGREVKRAYAKALKAIDVDRDPAAFIQLREARDLALQWGEELPEWERDDFDPEQDWADQAWDDPLGTGAYSAPPDFPFHLDPRGFESFIDGHLRQGANRLPPPPSDSLRLRTAMQALEALLFAPESPEQAAIEAAGTELLAACAEAPVDEASVVEHWLLPALAQSIPRSDPVFAMAQRHFGWGDAVRSRGYNFNPDLHDLLERRTARALLERIVREPIIDAGAHSAANELMRPGRRRLSWFNLELARDVKRFLAETVASHPMIEHDLDPATLQWWRGYFERRHLPDNFWAILFLCPFALTGFVAATRLIDFNLLTLGLAFLGSALAVGVAMLIFADLRARSARRERNLGWYGYTLRGALPLLAAAMVLPTLSALFAWGFWTAAGWSLAAVGLAVGGLFALPTPPRLPPSDQALFPFGFPAAGLAASITVGFALPLAAAIHVLIPSLILCLLVHRAHGLFAECMSHVPRRRAQLALAGAGLLAVAMIGTLFAFAPGLPPAPLLALIPAAAMAQQLATAGAVLSVSAAEWAARALAILFHVIFGQLIFAGWQTSALASILLYLLAYSLIRIVMAWRRVGYRETEPAYF